MQAKKGSTYLVHSNSNDRCVMLLGCKHCLFKIALYVVFHENPKNIYLKPPPENLECFNCTSYVTFQATRSLVSKKTLPIIQERKNGNALPIMDTL